jgi:glutamate 5-kinase
MRDISAKRIVIKVGTNTICRKDGTVDQDYIEDVARQVIELDKRNIQSIIVTSGAIGSGSSELGLNDKKKSIAEKQACAAVGQTTVMLTYRDAFMKYGKCVGQVLLTYGAFSDRKRYLNLRKTIDQLFELGAVPVVNENDVISTDEIEETFGDNDKLSALVASKVDADFLLMLTDVDGLYDRNPEVDPRARLIATVDEITMDIERIAGAKRNERSIGGMRTKIAAAKITMQSGCSLIIANGRLDNVILRVVDGEELGTLFTPRRKYTNKERWILFSSPRGEIILDQGAEKALREGKNLLPCGIVTVERKFRKGDVVRIGNFAKGISNLSYTELSELRKECLGHGGARITERRNNKAVVDNDNTILLK